MDTIDPPLPAPVLDAASAVGGLRRLAAGDILFHEGEASDTVYVLLSGSLKVYSRNDSGREVVYNVLAPGEMLGEMVLDGGPRSASVQALEASECLAIEGDDVRDLLRDHPEFAEVLVLKLIARLRHATRTIRGMALEGVYERVVALLERAAVDVDGQRRVPRTLTQAEIARRVGAGREMVHHVLQTLIQGGYIHKDRGHQMTLLKAMPPHW
jgi:CRP/FNR family cyclic AMP-dependent transcriptional regulator